jgi:hypothetical protein
VPASSSKTFMFFRNPRLADIFVKVLMRNMKIFF